MGIKYDRRILWADLSVADIELRAAVDEGMEITEIGVTGGAADLICGLVIGEENLLCFPSHFGDDSVVPVPGYDTNIFSLLRTIRKKFPDVPTPKICAGELMILSSYGAAGNGYVEYRHFMPDQIPAKDTPGASESLDRLLIFPNRATVSVAAGATQVITAGTSLAPRGFPSWVYPERVPAGVNYDLLGFATNLDDASGANIRYTNFRIWKGEKAILSPQEAFIPPTLFPYNDNTVVMPLTLFDNPITFITGENLRTDHEVSNVGAAAETAIVNITLIVHQKPAP